MAKTILIVDDFESSRNILDKMLKNAGYNVLQGEDGEKAMIIMDHSEIDMIITDLNMPNMDGITLIRKIRSKQEHQFTPVLLLTTNSQREKKEQAKEAGVTGWIEKPFQVEALLSNIRKIMR